MIQKLIQTSENNQINPAATKQIKEIIKLIPRKVSKPSDI